MASLTSHINVWETCLQLLARRGYHLEAELPDEDSPTVWLAGKNGFTFSAETPIALLGLATVYEDIHPETDHPYWWSANTSRTEPLLYDTLLEAAVTGQEERPANQ
ncbi:hypothetical protein ABT095_28720 [Kitasatospora sp. NPDC002227]|uniref:hypothetical protein n=1 Tax=Kitasatospora sp. NPDC002227 TaxID=3154773 RepID=UPI003317266B